MANKIKVVIGSWGNYNDNNERTLDHDWITLNDYNMLGILLRYG